MRLPSLTDASRLSRWWRRCLSSYPCFMHPTYSLQSLFLSQQPHPHTEMKHLYLPVFLVPCGSIEHFFAFVTIMKSHATEHLRRIHFHCMTHPYIA